jgi:prepilin-type N-terminal cleavage/methylation domain-containing protein
MFKRLNGRESGFTLIELVVVAAVLALLVALALPSYLGARNKAAIDEANGMAQEWRSLAYGCYLQTLDVTQCQNNAEIGFNEQAGKYWNWVSGTPGATYNVGTVSGTTAPDLTVSWPSNNVGLENGETYTVTMFVSGTSQGQSTATCIPSGC